MLERNFYGNSLLHWLIAVGVAVAVIVLLALRAWVSRLFESRHERDPGRRDAIVRAAVRGTQPWFLVAVAVYIGARSRLSPRPIDCSITSR